MPNLSMVAAAAWEHCGGSGRVGTAGQAVVAAALNARRVLRARGGIVFTWVSSFQKGESLNATGGGVSALSAPAGDCSHGGAVRGGQEGGAAAGVSGSGAGGGKGVAGASA